MCDDEYNVVAWGVAPDAGETLRENIAKKIITDWIV